MKTFLKKYAGYDSKGDYIEKTGEFVWVSQIEKIEHQTAVYRKAVDWCQSSIYIVKGIVFVEETFWQNCRLVGTGFARNTNQTIQEYLGESIYNYIIK